jgi:hypothetical protein
VALVSEGLDRVSACVVAQRDALKLVLVKQKPRLREGAVWRLKFFGG